MTEKQISWPAGFAPTGRNPITDKQKEDLKRDWQNAQGQSPIYTIPTDSTVIKLGTGSNTGASIGDLTFQNTITYTVAPTFTQEDVDSAYLEGHADGYKEGYADAEETLDR